MTPLKVSEYLRRQGTQAKPVQMMDLRAFGMQHAAPKEDDRVILKLRFDPQSGALVPAA